MNRAHGLHPGSVFYRTAFLSYAYDWNDIDYADGIEAQSLRSPQLNVASPREVVWPDDEPVMVIYVARGAVASCLVTFMSHSKLFWVPTHCVGEVW